ncbi:CRISPR-associated endonuclease Cas1 [Candidatus Methanoperedens nitroreducens]|uniref:CRISPR-associated endonuclease Cas1 n=1 Tax=Candidatus Methanoperedens nitratireducens TaxID=1392998 RepID=A0A062V1Z9_9EURY|nr:CRISPR-associated endonuclease Cas1 [Candidatus Methanoperedens nitroreducens]KCZ73131.1 CRISPR-associated endonuclease Cas1 [Candidatus Methanoperedens nitroreducens]MDJ1422920.1 CRISPR-associated endonuclease Cas1 [Candidatus Methanoperedens sp.]
MQLVINTRGAYLKKEKNCFLVKNDDKNLEVSADKVDSILITTSATITTDAIEFAVENNIDIVFLDFNGNPYGRVWHSKLGSTTLIRRRQLEAGASIVGFNMARGWIVQKLENQTVLLKDLKKNRPDAYDMLTPYISKLEQLKDDLMSMRGSLDGKRGSIMGTEGMASLTYFEALSNIMPDAWKFSGRSRNPAQDAFNCLLNYGYGILYSQVEKACIIAGLDPYMGFLHTDNYNKKSFVFDLIEIFRIHIDRTVVNLFSKKQVHDGLFDKIPGGLYLNKDGKAVLIKAVNETLDREIEYRGRNIKIRNTIQMECHSIANGLIK